MQSKEYILSNSISALIEASPTEANLKLYNDMEKGIAEVYDEVSLVEFFKDVMSKADEDDYADILEKAQKDISKLQKKVITDKNGKRKTVYVSTEGVSQGDHPSMRHAEAAAIYKKKKAYMSKDNAKAHVAKHYGEEHAKYAQAYHEGGNTTEKESEKPDTKVEVTGTKDKYSHPDDRWGKGSHRLSRVGNSWQLVDKDGTVIKRSDVEKVGMSGTDSLVGTDADDKFVSNLSKKYGIDVDEAASVAHVLYLKKPSSGKYDWHNSDVDRIHLANGMHPFSEGETVMFDFGGADIHDKSLNGKTGKVVKRGAGYSYVKLNDESGKAAQGKSIRINNKYIKSESDKGSGLASKYTGGSISTEIRQELGTKYGKSIAIEPEELTGKDDYGLAPEHHASVKKMFMEDRGITSGSESDHKNYIEGNLQSQGITKPSTKQVQAAYDKLKSSGALDEAKKKHEKPSQSELEAIGSLKDLAEQGAIKSSDVNKYIDKLVESGVRPEHVKEHRMEGGSLASKHTGGTISPEVRQELGTKYGKSKPTGQFTDKHGQVVKVYGTEGDNLVVKQGNADSFTLIKKQSK